MSTNQRNTLPVSSVVVVADNASAVVTCDDGNGKEVYQLAISWTDFPREAPRISQNGVLAAKPQHEMRVQPRMR